MIPLYDIVAFLFLGFFPRRVPSTTTSCCGNGNSSGSITPLGETPSSAGLLFRNLDGRRFKLL